MFKRGDIVSVNFPFSDGSGDKLRPALILSNDTISESGDVVVLMISSKLRNVDVTVELTPNLISKSLPKNSYVKCHRLYAIETSMLQAKFSSVSKEGMKLILNAVVDIIS